MNPLAYALFAAASLVPACAQLPPGTSDAASPTQASPDNGDDALLLGANQAIDRHDLTAALRILSVLAEKHPTDAHILFDLGSTQDGLDQNTLAEASYRRSIAADPNYFEPRLALGLLLARLNRLPDARTELLAAVGISTPDQALKARAYRALARVDQKQNPAEARDALLAALKLSPKTPEDTLLSAALAVSGNDAADAKQVLRRVLVQHPGDPAASAELARLLLARIPPEPAATAGSVPPSTTAVPAPSFDEIRGILEKALSGAPDNVEVNAELATLDLRQGQPDKALAIVGRLHTADPANPAITRLFARLLLQTGDPNAALPLLSALVQRSPADGDLLDQYADALIQTHKSAEAAVVLHPVLTQPGLFQTPEARAEAAGRLAFAAAQANDPSVTLQALELRATVLPRSPSSLFLAATAHDKLHHVKQAAELYRQFLAAAQGKFPDEEFEARHRLVTLAHMR